jgi:uncharacterized protein (TIGR02679 family)
VTPGPDLPAARAAGRLARAELAPLVDELVRRFGDGGAPASVALRGLPPDARRAVADLFGTDRVPPGGSRIPVERLLGALGLTSRAELREALEAVRGPLPDRRADRQAQRSARDSLWRWLEAESARLSLGTAGSLAAWAQAQRAAGARGGVEVHRQRLERALAVLRALPADGVALAALAADHAGDPHALDHGRSVAAIVLDAVAAAVGADRPTDAEAARLLWEAVGVAPDPLSSTVMALGLPGGDATPLDRWLAAAAACGEVVVLSLANLRRWPVRPLAPGACAVTFENPSLIAEAAGDWTGPPLVCSSGRPTVAVVTLLRQLGAGGATLYQHADFDTTGLAITAWLAQRAGTVPWRMTSGDYLAAVAGSGPTTAPAGSLPPTPWDPALAEAVRRHGVAVFEEAIRRSLLDDARRLPSAGTHRVALRRCGSGAAGPG